MLFGEWRTELLKRGTVGPGVAITNGQPWSHWRLGENDVLLINLEDMWADYEWSVERFIGFLHHTPDRRALALERHAASTYQVRTFSFYGPDGATGATASASAAAPGVRLIELGAAARKPDV